MAKAQIHVPNLALSVLQSTAGAVQVQQECKEEGVFSDEQVAFGYRIAAENLMRQRRGICL